MHTTKGGARDAYLFLEALSEVCERHGVELFASPVEGNQKAPEIVARGPVWTIQKLEVTSRGDWHAANPTEDIR